MKGTVLSWVIGFSLLFWGCETREQAPTQDSAPAMQPATAQQKQQGMPPRVLPTDTLDIQQFKKGFHVIGKPKRIDLSLDFSDEQLKGITHFERVLIRSEDGELHEFPSNDFYCIAFETSSQGIFEVITLRKVAGGKLMHLFTFDTNFDMIVTTELAREHEQNTEKSSKKGIFVDHMNFQYEYTLHQSGNLKERMSGTIVILPSGRFKMLGEDVGK